ncbi:MAG: MOSC domain-containing protein [Thermoplasmata archaeon]
MAGGNHVGTVVQLNRKSQVPGEHGLPKIPVPAARITKAGVEGDFNRYRTEEKQDDPDMAVLLLPLEVISTLNQEGWPVRPGDLGENITCSGLANDEFRPSRKVRIGPVLLEVSKPCDPCNNLFLLPYIGNSRGPAFLRTTLGRRGWYCRVVVEGTVRTGDRIQFEPA